MMSQNQISVGYHVQNPQNRTITIKFDPCYINVTSKMEDNKYHNYNSSHFMKLCS
jgi:hypothetical protein